MILFLKVGERQTSKKSSIQEERQLFIELESELWTMGLLRHLSKPMFVNHYFILHLLGFVLVLDIVFTIKKLFFPQRTTELGSKINVCFKWNYSYLWLAVTAYPREKSLNANWKIIKLNNIYFFQMDTFRGRSKIFPPLEFMIYFKAHQENWYSRFCIL